MTAQASALLSTKLNRPPVVGDRIDRPRLIEMLNRGLSGPMSLVSAAAGFGKTTLVSSWIEALNADGRPRIPTAWLSLDENDSDLVVFLRYLIAAIRTVYPESCVDSLALLQAQQPADRLSLVVALSNELERLPARIVVVLDDYHVIRSEAVHEFLGELIRHWPQHLHLVMISRTSPPLPLANLRAKGQLAEVRTRDLRFTLEESAAFLNKALPKPLTQSTVALLDQHIEGWAAGLRLATLSLRGAGDAEAELAGLSGTNVEIADYLVDQVVSRQTPELLTFMLVTSILNRFCADLCEWVLRIAKSDGSKCDAQSCIQQLESANLFVISLDNDRQWYRYHHLFQALLQRRLLAEMGPARVTELHRAAASWFAEHDLIDEGLHHALAIHDLDLAARLMEAGLCDVLNHEDRPTLERWLSLLPEAFIQQRPWLLMIKAVTYQYSWQLTAVWKLLGQIEALLAEDGKVAPRPDGLHDLPTLRGLIAALRGQEAVSTTGQAARAIDYCEEALTLLPAQWRYVRGGALIYWGIGMRAGGRAGIAERILIEEYEALLVKTDSYALRLLFTACFNALETGQLEQAGQLAQVMLEKAPSGRLMILQGWAHYFLGLVHYYWNELDAARQHWGVDVDKRNVVHVQSARNAMIGLVRMHLARAETAEAWQMVELLRQIDLDRLGQEGDDARSLRAQLEYLQGDTEKALRWADAYTTPVPDRLMTWLQDPHWAKANLLLARGTEVDVQAALDLLDTLYDMAERTFCVRCQVETLALRALALDMQGKTVAAFAELQHAVELARPGGFIRVFADLGPHMHNLLLRLAEQGCAPETVRRILAAFPEPPKKITTGDAGFNSHLANAELVEPLTSRELDVLTLLRERLSDKEIAHRLSLSTTTVKRHTANIYGKLGVNKRWNAVIEAESLGILPPR